MQHNIANANQVHHKNQVNKTKIKYSKVISTSSTFTLISKLQNSKILSKFTFLKNLDKLVKFRNYIQKKEVGIVLVCFKWPLPFTHFATTLLTLYRTHPYASVHKQTLSILMRAARECLQTDLFAHPLFENACFFAE